MWVSSLALIAACFVSSTQALGTTCSAALTPGAASGDPFWQGAITRKGISAFNSSPSSYKVFRNVKDYGATGNGVTDDTNAINLAISDGGRCGNGCKSSTKSPGLIYFPAGTYLVSTPIVPYYFSQLVGDPKNKPTLLASAGFQGIAVIDADPYIPGGGGAQYWTNQNNFFRSVRNFKIDLTRMPITSTATGLHWQVAQATTLVNIEVQMSQDASTNHQGIFMENGSGGFMSDLLFVGGRYGIWIGNQQFTVRNLEVRNARTAIFASWNWGWTFQGVKITDCTIGFEITTGGITESTQTVGSEVIVDGTITNVPTFIKTSATSRTSLAGSIVLDNIVFSNVGNGVIDSSSNILLTGGTKTVGQWAQGNKYYGTSTAFTYVQSTLTAPTKPTALLDSTGKIYGRSRPTYEGYLASQFVHVRDSGAKGDGVTDDTAAIQSFINQYWGCKILFFDAGNYLVTGTITIPTGSIVVGEIWTTILGGGSLFTDQANPKPVVKVGNAGEKGVVEISDMVFSTKGGSQGAIVVEWNTADTAGQKATAAMWDVHIRLGGTAGTDIDVAHCAKNSGHAVTPCTAAFIGLYITATASVYAEGTWVWTADHDLEDGSEGQIDVYTGRGIVSESTSGPVWLIGTGSEHHAIVQYSFVNSQNVYAGLIQTETPYYQPSPGAPSPFSISTTYNDPTISNGAAAWATYIKNSQQVFIYGAGHYSFFSSYAQTCLTTYTCQDSILKVDSASQNVYIYGLSTVGTTNMLNVDSTPIVKQSDNRNGFASTMTLWTSTVSTRPKRSLNETRRWLKEPQF